MGGLFGDRGSESANSTGAVCDQPSKFFVSHQKESMARHVGVKCVTFLKVREEKYKGKYVGAQMEARSQESCFCLPGAFKTGDNLWEGEKKEIPSQ
jgi:hypothetical protein